MTLTDVVQQAAVHHGLAEYPRESCGLVIIQRGRQVYVPCRNMALDRDQFIIDPNDYAAADERGEILAVIHSHPDIPPTPSQADLAGCSASGLAWHIVSLPAGQWSEIYPSGYIAPLVGREWAFGTLDCYSIIRDWYRQERSIELPDFYRQDDFWKRGENLYMDNFAKAGFHEIAVNDLCCGDVILMTNGSAMPTHGAVYLGDGMIIHHVQNRLSSREIYGGIWQKNTVGALRYGSSHSAG